MKTVRSIFCSAGAPIANMATGGRDALEGVGDLLTADMIPSPGDERCRLVEVTNSSLYLNQKCDLISIKFYALNVRSLGEPGESETRVTAQTANNILINSLDDLSYAYNQSRIRGNTLPSHQPNWFRPIVRFDGEPRLFLGLQQSSGRNKNLSNAGELSIGLNLPFDEEMKNDVPLASFDKLERIETFAQCLQIIDISPSEGIYGYQRYPVMCEMKFNVYGDQK